MKNIIEQRRRMARIRGLDILYSIGKPSISDAEYDALRDAAIADNPDHPHLNNVGSEYGVEYPLPIKMGSLNKIRPDDMQKWVETVSGGREFRFAVTPKLDGVAVLIEYSPNGKLVRALTRGDGHKGQDVTNSIKRVRGVPKDCYTRSCRMFVRGELIISKSSFKALQEEPKFTYVNPRNALVGCLNAKQKTRVQADVLSMSEFFAFSVSFMADPKYPGSSLPDLEYPNGNAKVACTKAPKGVQFHLLKKLGFMNVCDTTQSGNIAYIISSLTNRDLAKAARTTIHNLKNINYECDGLVIEADTEKLIAKGGVEANGINPKMARAVKLDPSEQEAKIVRVARVNWERTPRGLYKPVVELSYEARFSGVRVRNVYVDNAGWVKKNRVGAGATVAVIRSGDVIPRIIEVTNPANKGEVRLPKICRKHREKLVWTDSKTDLYCLVCAGEMNSPGEFFKHLEPENIGRTLVNHVCRETGVTSVAEVLSLTPQKLKNIDKFSTKRALQFSDRTKQVVGEASLAKLMHSSGAFRSPTLGMGETRLQSIIDSIGPDILMTNKSSPDDLAYMAERVDGIGKLVARCFGDQFKYFIEFFETIRPWAKAAVEEASGKKSVGSLSGTNFCFTGFRNKVAEALIRREGGKVSNSINKETTALFAASSDTVKAKRAKELGLTLVQAHKTEEFLNNIVNVRRKRLGLSETGTRKARKSMKRRA